MKMTFEEWSRKKQVTVATKTPPAVADQMELLKSNVIVIHYPDNAFITKHIEFDSYDVVLGNMEEGFPTLHKAERHLWENWSYSNCN